MCKILTIAGIKKDKVQIVDTFLKASVPFLTEQDNDSIGYAAVSDKLYGERWLNVEGAFKQRTSSKLYTKANIRTVDDPQYNKFGDRFGANHTSSMILHARFATCGLGLDNTHPFVSEDGKTALIHNGVVSTRNLTLKTSTCDSEGILNEYVKHDVSNNPNKIQEVFNKVSGAFACAVLTEDNIGNKFLDLFRNDQYPTLYCAYIQELEVTVYATTPEIIENTCMELGFTMEPMQYILDNSYLRLDAKTGEVLISQMVKRERSERLVAKSKKKGKRKKK